MLKLSVNLTFQSWFLYLLGQISIEIIGVFGTSWVGWYDTFYHYFSQTIGKTGDNMKTLKVFVTVQNSVAVKSSKMKIWFSWGWLENHSSPEITLRWMSQVNRCGTQDLLLNGHFPGDDDTCIPLIHMSKKTSKRD